MFFLWLQMFPLERLNSVRKWLLFKQCENSVREWLFFNLKCEIFRLHQDAIKLLFNQMIIMSVLYQINTLSYDFMVLVHWNKSTGRHVAPFRHIILIPRQTIFIVLAHCSNNSPRVYIWLHSDTLSWFRANQSLLLLHNS